MSVTVRRNPNDNKEKPTLEGTLRIGFFGGVTVASTSAFFDWGAKSLVLSFGKASGSSPTTPGTPGGSTPPSTGPATLELRTTISNGNMVDPIFVGANSGTHPLTLSKTGVSLFTGMAEDDYLLYSVDSKGKVATQYSAVLSLKQQNVPQMAPTTSDLPYFPGLYGSVTFESMGVQPQIPRIVLYDPIKGTLDMQFTDSSWMAMKGFFVASGVAAKDPGEFGGIVTVGGMKTNVLRARKVEQAPDVGRLPPRTFVGTYTPASTSLTYKSVAFLDYNGGAGTNSSEFPFLKFPNLKLQVLVCDGTDTLAETTLLAASMDYLGNVAVFRTETDPLYNPLELHWERGWQNLSGTFLKSTQTPGSEKPKVKWVSRPSDTFKGCQEDPLS